MKTTITKLIVMSLAFHLCLTGYTQKSIEKDAENWKDGNYDEYIYSKYSNEEWKKAEKQSKIEIIKDENGKVLSVNIDGSKYINKEVGWSNFVRFYTYIGAYSGSALYFTGGSIVKISLNIFKEKEGEFSIEAYYGKKPSKKIEEIIKNHILSTIKEKTPESWEIIPMVSNVKVIPILKKDQWKHNDYIDLGLELILNDGRIIKTNNLGGTFINSHVDYFSHSMIEKGVNLTDDDYACNCAGIYENEMDLEITLMDKMKTGTESKKFNTTLKVNCDDYTSPQKTEALKWYQYDSIGFKVWDDVEYQFNTYYLRKKGEFSYMNKSDLLYNKLANAQDKEEELILVIKNGKFGYVDFDMNEVIPCEYPYGRVGKFYKKAITVWKDGYYGAIDYNNKVVFPFEYDYIGEFHAGMAPYKKDGKWGYLKNTGEIITKPIYKQTYDFSFAGFGLIQTEDGKFGVLDKNGKILLKPEYEKIYFMAHPDAKVFKVVKDSKYALVDHTGKFLSGFDYEKLKEYRSISKGKGLILATKDYYYGFLDETGKVFKNFEYVSAEEFKDGYATYERYIDAGVSEYGKLYPNGEERDVKTVTIDLSGTNSSSSTSSYSSGKTNSGTSSSSSSSSSDSKDYSGSVYFKYDMMGSNSAPERLYIHYGSNGAYKVSTTKGSAATVKCQKGKVYYSLTGEKSDMIEFMEMTVDDCGKTFKYTDFK